MPEAASTRYRVGAGAVLPPLLSSEPGPGHQSGGFTGGVEGDGPKVSSVKSPERRSFQPETEDTAALVRALPAARALSAPRSRLPPSPRAALLEAM